MLKFTFFRAQKKGARDDGLPNDIYSKGL